MILLLTAVRDLLKNDITTSTTAVGGIHIQSSPQNSKLPNVVLTTLNSNDQFTHQGPMNLHRDIVRIYCRGGDLEELSTLERVVHTALQAKSGSAFGIIIDRIFHRNGVTDDDEKSEIIRAINDYEVRYRLP